MGKEKYHAPKHLRPATRRWVEQVVADYVIESHHLKLLLMAGESWDRSCEAREAIQKHGMVCEGRFGPKPRPEIGIEHNAKIAFARLLREIGLDVNDPDEARPPRGRF
jgi:phage terminase small subunit